MTADEAIEELRKATDDVWLRDVREKINDILDQVDPPRTCKWTLQPKISAVRLFKCDCGAEISGTFFVKFCHNCGRVVEVVGDGKMEITKTNRGPSCTPKNKNA